MAGDLNFATPIANTFLLTLVVVPLQVALALAMATMVHEARHAAATSSCGC